MTQEKEKRNKPKIFNGFIAVLLVLATISACSVFFGIASKNRITVDDTKPTVEEQINNLQRIKLPSGNVTEIYSDPVVFEKLYNNTEITYEHTANGGKIIAPEGHSEISSAYAYVKLTEDGTVIPLENYNYLTLEFDVASTDGKLPLGCQTYLINRGNAEGIGTAYSSAATNVFIIPGEEGGFKVLNDLGVYTSREKTSFNVKYVFKINHNDITKSQLQIWVDGNVRYDSTLSEKVVFASDVTHVDELRIKKFSENGGEITFSNLYVKGYK